MEDQKQKNKNDDNINFYILSREYERDSFFSIFKELSNFSFGIFVEKNGNSQKNNDIANVIGKMLEENLTKAPTLDKKKLERMIFNIHNEYKKSMGEKGNNTCSIIVFITDFVNITFVNIGGLKYLLLRDGEILLKNREHTIAYLMYEAKKITYEDMRKRKDKNTLTHKFGIDKSIVIDITDPIPIDKNDKIIVYNYDIWDLIEENDINNMGANRLKNLFEGRENYLFFNGTILSLTNKIKRKIKPIPTKNNIFSPMNKYKIYLGIVFLVVGIVLGIKTYLFYNVANHLYALAVKNETVGNVEFENENFKFALSEYEKSLENYIEYYDYTGKTDNGKEEYMNNLIKQTKDAIYILEELEIAEELIYTQKFREALTKINTLNIELQTMKVKNKLEHKVIDLYSTALVLNIAYENKLTADELMDNYNKSSNKNIELKKKAEKLYEKSALIFLENSFVDLYEEIAYKQTLDIENIVKFKKTDEIIRTANKAFREFKYYKSLKLYTSALKMTKNPRIIEMLNNKIKMNNIVLMGVKAELAGDRLKINAVTDEDMKKAIAKYKEAKKYYSILEDNASIPKYRYVGIINRVSKKINEE